MSTVRPPSPSLPPSPPSPPSGAPVASLSRRRFARGSALLAAAPLLAGATGATGTAYAAPRTALPHASGAGAPAAVGAGQGGVDTEAVRRALAGLVAEQHLPGAQAVITDARGRVVEVSAGAGDLATGRPYPHRARLRIASHTKSFVATVLLQLVAAGKVELSAPVERYLPGVVRGGGNDGRRISVHQLLQHTSGLPEFAEEFDEHTPGHHTAERVVAESLRQPPLFPPGERWSYCNLGYLLLGMLIERVTGRPVEHEVRRRVIARLGLAETYWPRWPEQRLRGPHAKAYQRTKDGGHREVTFINTSVIGAAGALISTAQELTEFYRRLLDGELLPPAQLAQMKHTLPADIARGAAYGLGLARYPLGEGTGATGYWGHGGSVAGTRTRGGITTDGRAVLIAVNELAPAEDASQAVVDTVERIFRHVPRGPRTSPRQEGDTPS